jgi:spore coat protein CotH
MTAMTCVFRAHTIALSLGILALAAPAAAQSATDFFNPSVLHEIRLTVNTRDLRDLRARYRDDTYYAADFQWRGLRVRNVGIRSRGNASRSNTKLALRVDFNRYTTGQRFLGLKSVILKNLWQDGSMLHERLAMQLFARLGQPASRETYSRLYINNEYQGLYSIVESVDRGFLERTLGEDDGHLFSYQFTEPYHGEYLGEAYEPYKRQFQAESDNMQADSVLYGPIRSLLREVNHPQDAVWRQRVEEYLDLRQLVTHVAIENFLAEDDGFLGHNGMNNFYLYREAGSTRHRLLPWDKDSAFHSYDFPIFHRAEDNVVIRKAFAFADLREQYFRVLEEAARSAAEAEREGDPGWMEVEIVRTAELISGAVQEDTRKPFSTDAFFESVEILRDFARRRSAFVLEQVRLARAGR